MSIVQFLEHLGASSNQLSAASYAQAVDALGLDAAARDAEGISALLGGRAAMRCLVATPD